MNPRWIKQPDKTFPVPWIPEERGRQAVLEFAWLVREFTEPELGETGNVEWLRLGDIRYQFEEGGKTVLLRLYFAGPDGINDGLMEDPPEPPPQILPPPEPGRV